MTNFENSLYLATVKEKTTTLPKLKITTNKLGVNQPIDVSLAYSLLETLISNY